MKGNEQVLNKTGKCRLDKRNKKINPNYFPLGLKIPDGKFPREITGWTLGEPIAPNLFKEKDLNNAYKFTCKYLQVQKTFDPKQHEINLDEFYNNLFGYLDKMMNLLRAHLVT